MNKAFSFLLFTALIGSFFSTAMMSASYAILFLAYLPALYLSNDRSLAKSFHQSPELKACIPLAVGILFGVIISNDLTQGWKEGKAGLHLCLMFIIVGAAAQVKPYKLYALLFLCMSLEFGIAVYQFLHADPELRTMHYRFSGKRHFSTDAFFAFYALLLSLFCLLRKTWFKTSLALFILSFAFLILTQNRTMLIAFLCVLPLLFLRTNGKIKLIAFSCLILLFIAAKWNPYGNGFERATHAFTDFFSEMDNSASSMGTRYELWKASYQIFLDTSGFGTGYGDFRRDLFRMQREGELAKDLNTLQHVHSIYFQMIICAGWIGLLGLLATLLIFFKQSWSSFIKKQCQASLMKLILILSFMLLGVFDSHLDDSIKIIYFCLIWAITDQAFTKKQDSDSMDASSPKML